MTRDSLYKLLQILGIVVARDDGEWLTISCPLAYKFHLYRSDEHPSCGISYDNTNSKRSIVNCFTCGSRDLLSVLTILFYDKKIDYDILRFYIEHEQGKADTRELNYIDIYEETDDTNQAIPVYPQILECLLPAYKSVEVKRYFKQRRINLNLTYNVYTWKGGVVFPIRDVDNKIYKLHYRSRSKNKKNRFFFLEPEHFGLSGKWGAKHLWYNIENIDWTKPVFLVEGEFDVLRLITLGIHNVIACCGGISKEQIQYLQSFSPICLYLGFDSDLTGKKYTSKIIEHFRDLSTIYRLNWGIVGVKDAGDLKSRQDLDKVLKKSKIIS